MDNLNFDIFIVPIIVLVIITGFYSYFSKTVKYKERYRCVVFFIALSAFLSNLVWELLHAPLYSVFGYDFRHVLIYVLASVADMLMVLLLYFVFAILNRDGLWVRTMSTARIIALMTVGGLGAIFSEMWHTARGDWQYAYEMPVLPILEVGISPILQFVLLPWLSFFISKKLAYNF